MAFNLVAEGKNVDWVKVRDEIFKSSHEYLNIYPIVSKGGVDSIGISVPMKNLNVYCWEELSFLLHVLITEFSLKVYELYNGDEITISNIESLKKMIGFKF